MYNVKSIVRVHKTNFAILLFVAMFSLMHYVKPAIIYNEHGGFREFGVGYRQKTVIPIWMASIILAIMAYLAVLYYLMYL